MTTSLGIDILIGKNLFNNCAQCGIPKKSHKGRFCGNVCYQEDQYQRRVKKWLLGELDGRRGKTATAQWVKRYVIETRGPQCEMCKNTEWLGTPILLELEHVDGDWKNNQIDNLKLLCLNCHGMTPTYRSKNRYGRPRAEYYRGT